MPVALQANNRLDDEELIKRIKDGDMDSFDVLVRAYLPSVYNKVHNLVPEPDVDDVTQDIFMSLVDSIDSFEGRSAFDTWFYKITMNRVADYHRKTSRRKEDLSEKQVCGTFNPWEETDETLTIEEALSDIPSKYKEVLLLKFSEGLSFVEIARKLSLTYEATRSRYRRAITAIKMKYACRTRKID